MHPFLYSTSRYSTTRFNHSKNSRDYLFGEQIVSLTTTHDSIIYETQLDIIC